ncbi:response regulator transcription factor [Aliikangiella coralliicola]|uniref:Response regulator transcription factor n=1 Tax=Aliikangiella coralliicola TaxID=2592383 RepID=A0A545U986_9GAMM|nr:response regulator transcription factor [Aliikangiella coralliicola]
MKLLLVDDQNLVRMGICSLLQLTDHIDVVEQLDDGTGVLSAINEHQPDIMLLDIRMPRMDGLAVLETLNAHKINLPTLILTTFDEHELVLNCLELGAKGYLRKDVTLENLVNAIDAVAAGKMWVQPAITNQVLEHKDVIKSDKNDVIEPLSENEIQVLRLIAAGYSNNEIASAIHRSVGTVRNLVSFILAKLQVRDRTRAVLKAIENGLI